MFDKACLKEFEHLKEQLIFALVIIAHDLSTPFELMCDENGLGLSVVLGQTHEKMFHPTYYAGQTLNEA